MFLVVKPVTASLTAVSSTCFPYLNQVSCFRRNTYRGAAYGGVNAFAGGYSHGLSSLQDLADF